MNNQVSGLNETEQAGEGDGWGCNQFDLFLSLKLYWAYISWVCGRYSPLAETGMSNCKAFMGSSQGAISNPITSA